MKVFFTRVAFLATALSALGASAEPDCAAQNVLDACLATTQGYVSQCQSTDYTCLCDKYTAIMTCFNVCPSDSRAPSTSSQRDLNCMNASLLTTTTTSVSSSNSRSRTTASATATGDESDAEATGTNEAVSGAASTGGADAGNAADHATAAGRMLAVVAGAAVALL